MYTAGNPASSISFATRALCAPGATTRRPEASFSRRSRRFSFASRMIASLGGDGAPRIEFGRMPRFAREDGRVAPSAGRRKNIQQLGEGP